MTFEEAGRAVLQRDNELTDAAMAKTEQGELIRTELARHVYQSVRGIGGVLKEANHG